MLYFRASMTLRWTLRLSVLLLAWVIGSCAWLGQLTSGGFQKPSLAYKSVSLSDVSLSGATVDVVTTVTNPNAVDLSVAEVDYRLSVDGHPVASGKPPAGIQIPARGSADVTLPATVQFAELGQALSTFLTQDSAKYKAEGTVGLNTPVGIVRVPMSHEGTFPVPKIPAISLGVPRITHAALDQATVELPLVLTNRSPYPLPIRESLRVSPWLARRWVRCPPQGWGRWTLTGRGRSRSRSPSAWQARSRLDRPSFVGGGCRSPWTERCNPGRLRRRSRCVPPPSSAPDRGTAQSTFNSRISRRTGLSGVLPLI
jgi:LEA14-like dessication related protein